MNVRANDASLRSRWDVSTDAPPRLRIESVAAAKPRVVSGWLYGFWLATSVAVWATLFFILPAFETMFLECGLVLPAPMDALIYLSQAARSPLGVVASLAVLAGSVGAFLRLGDRKALRWCFGVLALLGILFFPFALMALRATLSFQSGPL